MISNCVNPTCRVPFSHTRNGRIFAVERIPATVDVQSGESQSEEFWLCGACCQSFKVIVEKGHVRTIPIELESVSLAS